VAIIYAVATVAKKMVSALDIAALCRMADATQKTTSGDEPMTHSVLALNAGSSSTKLAIFEIRQDGKLGRVAAGKLEGVGTAPHFVSRATNGKVLAEQTWPRGEALTHEDFLGPIIEFAEHALGQDTLAVVGHRVVHGGSAHVWPERVTDDVLVDLEKLVALAPLHQPHSLAPMRTLAKLRPNLLQIACFDTAFHHTMPEIATWLGLPRTLHQAGVRRYGFHGLSYEYISETLKEEAPHLAAGRVIAAHLGNGASLCAIRGGRSVDTSMGFTAMDGLMMGTLCGAIDPGAVLHLQLQLGMSAQAVEDLLYHKSGLLGVSEISSDLRTLGESTDPRAAEAIALFELRIVREIGALSAILGGLEGLVFTAAIGEHIPKLRKNICDRLHIPLDTSRNEIGLGKISARDSGLEVWVVPTDEEAMIARHAATFWEQDQSPRALRSGDAGWKATRGLFGKG
jgi:acetate kinase